MLDFTDLQWWWQLVHNLPCGDAFSKLQSTPQLVQQPPAAWVPAVECEEGVVRPVHDESLIEFGEVWWRCLNVLAARLFSLLSCELLSLATSLLAFSSFAADLFESERDLSPGPNLTLLALFACSCKAVVERRIFWSYKIPLETRVTFDIWMKREKSKIN